MGVYYDLHIHTALSPCGDNDMTPNNIVNMAMISGLDVIAITDHNTTGNCLAVQQAAKGTPLTVLCGMELCTSEEVHTVCLLPDADSAWYFERLIASKSPTIKNRTDIFGAQLLMDELDNIVGEEQRMLLAAADISITDLHHIVNHYGGVVLPAHIDRSGFGILSVLGAVPDDCFFGSVEVKNPSEFVTREVYNHIKERYHILNNSDAHSLENIKEGGEQLPSDAAFKSIAGYITERE